MNKLLISAPVALAVGIAVSLSAPGLATAAPMLSVAAKLPQLPRMGERVLEFEAMTNRGPVKFPGDYRGKWVVFFSHPGDFTPVCTSEFVLLASIAKELKALNTELLGLSVGTVADHDAWTRVIEDEIEFGGIKNQAIDFPIIADLEGELAWSLGMIHPQVTTNETVRAVFVIDPTGVIRAMLFYPHEAGRNIAEIKRLVVALQTSDAHQVLTPAEWRPGDDVLVRPSKHKDGKSVVSSTEVSCQAGFFCRKSLGSEKAKPSAVKPAGR